MGAGLAVAADPPRTSYQRLARVPDAISVGVSLKQARRLLKRLREPPRAIAIFDPAQYPLARGILTLLEDCQLFYEHTSAVADPRSSELHALAAERADLRFTAADPAPLREALAQL